MEHSMKRRAKLWLLRHGWHYRMVKAPFPRDGRSIYRINNIWHVQELVSVWEEIVLRIQWIIGYPERMAMANALIARMRQRDLQNRKVRVKSDG